MYSLTSIYTIKNIKNEHSSTKVLEELNKERIRIHDILGNAEYYDNSTKTKYLKASLDIYKKAAEKLEQGKIENPQLLLATIKKNHLTFLKESTGRIIKTIKNFETQKRKSWPSNFIRFFNKSIVTYKKILQQIRELDHIFNKQQKEKLIEKTLEELNEIDKKTFHFCK